MIGAKFNSLHDQLIMAIFKDNQGTLNKLNALPLDKEKKLLGLIEQSYKNVL